eukprot:CAMPEP_0173217184 /NCGR_PEP_ID=MMETSP1142-20121109/352_1 /TAXON_ID=483371 /ORGANISM="non described non described, Strain CCMP2298" /LENGTH=293 /DNA_ID=CAMNT_0014144731 /DNA_START=18 /DNA_END=900 /DNA_ORIENTATION=-
MAVSSNKFVAKEWLLSDPESAFTSVVEFMDTFQDARIDGKEQYHLVFAKQMVLTNIFTSNKLEGTLSSSLSHSDTYGLLGSLYDDVDKDKLDVPPIHWKADGDGDAKATRFQLACHLDAVLYMTSEDMITRDLDVDDVLTVHRLMMKNATEKDGTFLRSGDFHNVDVRAGEHLYPPGNPGALREACEKIVAEFNSSLGAEGKCFIEVTSKLFYDMITLHPFSDGNGTAGSSSVGDVCTASRWLSILYSPQFSSQEVEEPLHARYPGVQMHREDAATQLPDSYQHELRDAELLR